MTGEQKSITLDVERGESFHGGSAHSLPTLNATDAGYSSGELTCLISTSGQFDSGTRHFYPLESGSNWQLAGL